jgi:hypothetical protein
MSRHHPGDKGLAGRALHDVPPFQVGDAVVFSTVSRQGRSPERDGTVANVYRRVGGWWVTIRLADGTRCRTRPSGVRRTVPGPELNAQ